jgi:hypothetical protein
LRIRLLRGSAMEQSVDNRTDVEQLVERGELRWLTDCCGRGFGERRG